MNGPSPAGEFPVRLNRSRWAARPFLCQPHGGAPAAATNVDAAGANCGWRDARAGRRAQGRFAAGPTNGAASARAGSWAATMNSLLPLARTCAAVCDLVCHGADRRKSRRTLSRAARSAAWMLHLASTQPGLRRTFLRELVMDALNVPVRASGRRRRDSLGSSSAVERRRFSVASREHGPRPTSPPASEFLVRAHATSNAATIQRAGAKYDARPCVRTTRSL